MNLGDNTCPICLYVFIQPVTMPCNHELCLSCFEQNVQTANFCCPMCRVRISSWARKAARNNKLVNEKRWKEIKKAFPEQVKNRMEGLEEEDEEMNALNISIKLAEPGEIRNEYEEQLNKLRDQRAEERRLEAEASERLILHLQAEELKKAAEQEEILKQDEQFARKLSQFDDDVASERNSRTSSTNTGSRSNTSSSCEILLNEVRNDSSSPLNPFLSTNSTPESGRKSTEQQRLMRKIRHDENLITTQDIELLEESFKKNTPCTDSQSCILKNSTPTIQSETGLHRKEILDQMSENICIQLYDDESNQSTINPIPVFPLNTDTPLNKPATATATKGDDSNSSDREDNSCSLDRSHSTDSISHELNHFRPIRSCPLTPPRRLPSGQVVEPMLIRTTPRNISKSVLGSPCEDEMDMMAEIDAGSPIMRRRLSELAEERKDKVTKMSKSTCTAGGTVPRRDENKNPDYFSDTKNTGTSPGLANRNVDFKDISNSTLLSGKEVVENTERIGVKKKLIIPLEPDLTENDELELIEPLKILKQSSPIVVQEKVARNNGRLSRRRGGGKMKSAYTESPQCSLMKWAKPLDSLPTDEDCINLTGDDDMCGDASASKNNSLIDSPRSRRNQKALRNPDYLYDNWKRKRDDPNCTNSTVGDNELDFSPAKRPRVCTNQTSPRKDRVKTSTVTSKSDTSVRVLLKHNKQPLKVSKSNQRKLHSSHVVPKKSSSSRTLCDFFGRKEGQVLTQEEMDRKMAQELQKQFEMEAKFHLNAIRFKGSTEEYSLRGNRRKTVVSDYEY